jgi:hypothetical protein
MMTLTGLGETCKVTGGAALLLLLHPAAPSAIASRNRVQNSHRLIPFLPRRLSLRLFRGPGCGLGLLSEVEQVRKESLPTRF